MSHINLKGIFWFVSFLICFCFAQETYNLDIIWQKGSPDSVFYFGRCIASGDVNDDSFSDIMIVGDSVFHSPNPDSFYRGVCWVFLGGSNPDTILDIRLSNLQKCIFRSLTSTDVNGDGFSDVCCGATNNAGGYGAVLIFLGGNPMDSICDYVLRGPSGGSCFGCAVSSGDVNGDSFADLIVGAYGAYVRPGFFPGRVYIYFGGPGFDTIPDVILNGGHENDLEQFGNSVSGSGDVNNDGFDDIIIGARTFGPNIQGRIYIYFGGNPMDTIYDVAMIGEGSNQSLGWFRVDFLKNNSTYDYAITGCRFWPYGFPREGPGKVYILFGGNLMDSIPDVLMIGRTDTSGLGECTASAGDLNGDSCDDIISGAPIEYDHKGTAYIWLGGTLLDTIPDAWIRGEVGRDRIGFYVATADDVDGDGKDEIMVSNYAGSTTKRVWVCKYTGPGIEERLTQNAEHLTLEINPNPAKGVLRVRVPPTLFLPHSWGEDRRRGIKIFDVSGKLIKEIASALPRNDGMVKISLKGISQGIYFLRVGKETKKFLVVK